MIKIKIKDLGLAAYCKSNGCKLLSCENRLFEFETNKKLLDWEVEYANSCCRSHDQEIMSLRKFLTR